MELIRMLSANEIVAQIISFLILLLLLRIFLWKPVLKILDERGEKVASDLKSAQDDRKEADALKSEYRLKLLEADKEARSIIDQAIEDAKDVKLAAQKAANQEAERIAGEARQNVVYELSKAKEHLKERIIDISIMAAENVIQEKLTAELDKKIIKDFLDQVEI